MAEKIYTIEQISKYIRGIFDAEELLHNISVSGEISNLNIIANTAYFVLKDSTSQINCIYFNYNVCHNILNGDKVIVKGTPKYYPKGGRLSFSIKSIERAGEGDLFKRFLMLKEKLSSEGLFNKKIQMPSNIRRIGVVSSLEGAVIRDIVNVASRRDPSIDIVLYPVRVQGASAEEEIENAIITLDNYIKIDCIIVARGGGSLEDLAAFNSEKVARAVAECKKFIVSAVGHETDFTLCDFCSDLRAPTPSAAAELLTNDTLEKKRNCLALMSYIDVLMTRLFTGAQNKLRYLSAQLNGICRLKITELHNHTLMLARKLNDAIQNRQNYASNVLDKRLMSLEYLNPLKILWQGYAKLFTFNNCSKNESAITSIHDLEKDSEIKIRLHDGIAKAKVLSITEKNN